jgi:integrase
MDYRKIPYNPCSYKPPVRKPKPKAKKLLTKKQSIAVYNQIRNSDFPYYINYLAVLNMTGIRPKEIYSLLIKNIDLKSKVIFVPADDTKDSEDRMVPIPKVLIPYLKELNLDEYPDDYYVFGYNFLPEQRVMPVKRDVSTKLWKRLIKDPVKDGGLGIESNQYWLKAQGMRDAREAGVSAEAVQLSRGHANYDESLGYIGLNRPSNVKELENKTPDPWKDKQSKKPRLRGLSE